MNTEYRAIEAEKMQKLPWYQDEALHHLIMSTFECNKQKVQLVDLCSGLSVHIKSFLSKFEYYVGVEKSQHMIKLAKSRAIIDNIDMTKARFINGCVIDYVTNHLKTEETSHILIKNALQFFNIDMLFYQIKNNSKNNICLVISQTINDDTNGDIFPYLPQMEFKNRLKKFYSEADIKNSLVNAGFSISKTKKHIQYISLKLWLEYHGGKLEDITNAENNLKQLSLSERSSLGVVLDNDNIFLRRVIWICGAKKI